MRWSRRKFPSSPCTKGGAVSSSPISSHRVRRWATTDRVVFETFHHGKGGTSYIAIYRGFHLTTWSFRLNRTRLLCILSWNSLDHQMARDTCVHRLISSFLHGGRNRGQVHPHLQLLGSLRRSSGVSHCSLSNFLCHNYRQLRWISCHRQVLCCR